MPKGSGFNRVIFLHTCVSEAIIKKKLGKSLYLCDGKNLSKPF